MKKIFLFFISFLFIFLLVSCKDNNNNEPAKDYERPQAEIEVNKEKSKYYYDKVELNFTLKIKNTYKFKDGDRISAEYKNAVTGATEKPYAAKVGENEYILYLTNLSHNTDTEVKFNYHYHFRGKDSKRQIADLKVNASGESDPLDNAVIRDYDDYIKYAKENMEEYIKDENKNIRKNYILENDIDFKDKEFLPLGYNFSGVFNGNNHTFKNISSSTMIYDTFKKDGQSSDKKIPYKYHFYGIFKNLLDGGEFKDLKFENVNLNNSEAKNKDSYDYDRSYKDSGFGLVCERAGENTRISNISLNNVKLNLTVKPGFKDLNKSFLDANFGLIAGSTSGLVSNIKILNSEIKINNKGASGASLGIVLGRANDKALVEFVSVKDSMLDIVNNINPNLLLPDDNKVDRPSRAVSDYYNKLGDNPKRNLSIYAGIVAGYVTSNSISSLYLVNNLVRSLDEKNTDKIATVRLNGKGIGFDFDVAYSDKSGKISLTEVDKKFYRVGERARVYMRTDTYTPNQSDVNTGVKRLYINNREISKSDLKEEPRVPFLYYYEFTVYENTDILSITNTYEKREDAQKENVYFENNKKQVYENITPGTFPNETQSLFKIEQDAYYQVKKEKYNKYLHGYAVITFKELKDKPNNPNQGSSSENNKYEKVYSWAKIDQNGKFRFLVRGRIEKIEIMGQFISENNIGQVYGFGKKITAAFLSGNKTEIIGDGQNTISNINLTEMCKYTYNLGLYASNHNQLEILNTVFENYVIKNENGNTIFDINFDKSLVLNHYNNQNIFIGNKPSYLGSDVDVLINNTFNKNSKEDIKKYLVLGYLINEEWFLKEFGI